MCFHASCRCCPVQDGGMEDASSPEHDLQAKSGPVPAPAPAAAEPGTGDASTSALPKGVLPD